MSYLVSKAKITRLGDLTWENMGPSKVFIVSIYKEVDDKIK